MSDLGKISNYTTENVAPAAGDLLDISTEVSPGVYTSEKLDYGNLGIGTTLYSGDGNLISDRTVTFNTFDLTLFKNGDLFTVSDSSRNVQTLYQRSNTTTDGPQLNFDAQDGNSDQQTYGRIEAEIATNTVGAFGGELNFYTANSGTLTLAAKIDNNNRLGLGTFSSIQSKTHILSASGESPIRIDVNALNNALYIDADGLIGMGKQSGFQKLEVDGQGNKGIGLFNGVTNNVLIFNGATNAGALSLLLAGAVNIRFSSVSTQNAYINNGGGLGIGVGSGVGGDVSAMLHVDGDIRNDNRTTTGATAGADTLPSNPVGFWEVNLDGTERKIPYYAV